MKAYVNEHDNNELSDNNNDNHEQNYPGRETTSTNVDLSNIEASEETMEGYTFPKEFLKLDLDKIREFIEILEEHYQSCLKEENIILAKSVKQRIILLKRLEKEKMKIEANIIYSNQRELVEDKMQEDLDNYLNSTNQEFSSLLQAFENQEVEMLKNHQHEIDEFKKKFDKIYENKKPKPSRECLNWIKIREYAIKQNKFEKAKEANKEINKLKEKDNIKFKEYKEKKLNAELNKITHRHENEKNALMLKKNSIIDMFNQTKDKNVEQIKKKYEAKLKELKNYQNFEMANFDKITKGITKPCARIQSIVSSTTGYKEEGEDEKDEIKGKEEEGEENGEEENENNKKNNNNDNNNEGEEHDNNENEEEEHLDENEEHVQENEHEPEKEQEQENSGEQENEQDQGNEQDQDNEQEQENEKGQDNEQEQENEQDQDNEHEQENENEQENEEQGENINEEYEPEEQ